MENEQLKQKAEEYAKENSANLIEVELAFLAGASFVSQNRDEEIERLKALLKKKDILKKRCK